MNIINLSKIKMTKLRKIRSVLFLIFFLQLTSCSSTLIEKTSISDNEFLPMVNELCAGQNIEVVTSDNEYFGRFLKRSQEKLEIVVENKDDNNTVINLNTELISKITINKSSNNIIRNLGIGAVTGLGVGLLIGEIGIKFLELESKDAVKFVLPASIILGIGMALYLTVSNQPVSISFN